MNNQDVIVCERSGIWAAALRRELRSSAGVCETRSWAACEREIQARGAALVALEVSPESVESACARLAGLTQRLPHTRVILLADRGLKHAEWILREAGAVGVVYALSDLPRLQPVLRRFREQLPNATPSFHDLIQSRLPWRQHASTPPTNAPPAT